MRRVERAHVVDEAVVNERAPREEERHRRRDLIEQEQIELFPELAVIARLRVFDQLEMLFERLFRSEGGPVDALKHRVLLVAAPIRAGDARELDRLQEPGRGHVRTPAHVEPFLLARAVTIEAHLFALGEALDDLFLERLAHLVEERERVGLRDRLLPKGRVPVDDREHRLLDRLEILVGEAAAGLLEVVVEAVVDRRPDRHLGAGKELLHRVRHDVGGGVADDVETVFVGRAHDLEGRVGVDHRVDVDDVPVRLDRDDVVGEQFFRLQEVAYGDTVRHGTPSITTPG